jgi:DNA-binding phage protein
MMLRARSMPARSERSVKNFKTFVTWVLDARGRSAAAVLIRWLLQAVHDSKMMAVLAVLADLNRKTLRRNDFEDRQPTLPRGQTSVPGSLARLVHLRSQNADAFAVNVR